jgi:vitamin B12 transporter
MYKYLLSGISLIAATPALAQDDAASEEMVFADARIPETQITVTATGTPIELEDTGQAVTVIGQAEIERVQGHDVTRVLERVPGVTFARNGPPGAFTGVRVRGAEAEQLLVVLDGVRMADPAAPGGGFDFANLAAGNLSKIDLMRGSNSTIWGSDAIGGVLVASTRAESGIRGSAEYGARDTAHLTASGGLAGERGFLGGAASWYRTDGFSAAAGGTEPDGFEQVAANGQGRIYFSDRFEVFVRGRYAKGKVELDGFPAPNFTLADTDEYQKTRQYSGAAGAVYDSGFLFLSASWSLADTARELFDPALGTAPTYTTDGRSDRLGLTGEWRPIGPLILAFGGSYEWTRFETMFDPGHSTGIAGAYAQLGIEFGPISGHAGVRHDDHREFGGATSFGADLSYELAPRVRLRSSIGEGFKAPSLFQLHSDFGNSMLRPEKSTSMDLGLALGERGQWPHAAVTVYRRTSTDLIGFVSCFGLTTGICAGRPFGTYDNIGRARSQGVEVEAGAELVPGISLLGAWSLSDNENRTAGSSNFGNPLPRRPRHALSLAAEWDLGGPAIGADLRWVSHSFYDAAATVRLDSYTRFDITARWPVNERVELFGRIENFWDAEYQTAAGYGSPGRGAFVGVRLR